MVMAMDMERPCVHLHAQELEQARHGVAEEARVVEHHSKPRRQLALLGSRRGLVAEGGARWSVGWHTHHGLALVVGGVGEAQYEKVEEVIGVVVHVPPQHGVAAVELARIGTGRVEQAPLDILHVRACDGAAAEVNLGRRDPVVLAAASDHAQDLVPHTVANILARLHLPVRIGEELMRADQLLSRHAPRVKADLHED
eukprot:6445304-Prymnesium_polylepis.1